MDRFQLRRDTAARWAEVNPILLEGEIGFETDTKRRKIGDGVHRWNVLEYLAAENIVQETGDSDKVVMSQKAVTEKLSELGQEVGEVDSKLSTVVGGVKEVNVFIEYGKNLNTTTVESGATPIILDKGDVYVSLTTKDGELDSVGLVTLSILRKDGTSIFSKQASINKSVVITLPEPCYYIGFYKAKDQIVKSGNFKFEFSVASQMEDVKNKQTATENSVNELFDDSYTVGNRMEVYKTIKGYTNANGKIEATTSDGFSTNIYDISSKNFIGVYTTLTTLLDTFAVLLSNDENFQTSYVVRLKDGVNSFIFPTIGYKYAAFGVDKKNESHYLTDIALSNGDEDITNKTSYSITQGASIGKFTFDTAKKVNLQKGKEYVIKFAIEGDFELHPNTYIVLYLYKEDGTEYIKHFNLNYTSEYRFIPTENIAAVGFYFNGVFAISNGMLNLFVVSEGLTSKYKHLVEEVSRRHEVKYIGKTCLYIGDSISTKDYYNWKGYIEQMYKVSYVRDVTTSSPDTDVDDTLLAPANGGIKVKPSASNEVSLLNKNKSIWYRCANNRMSIYDFDMISLFGGTNDLFGGNIILGGANDVPFVDDSSKFSESTTDVWSESLTFAQVLKGCILMLQRDFPTKEIVLPTIMYCKYNNIEESIIESVAVLQAQIADKLGIKCVPLYWDAKRTLASSSALSTDGVHPNTVQARRMAVVFGKTLGF